MKKYFIGILLGIAATASIGVYAFGGTASGGSGSQGAPVLTLSCPAGQHVYSLTQTCTPANGSYCYVASIACS